MKPGRQLRRRLVSALGWLALAGLASLAAVMGGARYLVCSLPQHQGWIESLVAARGLSQASLGRVEVSCAARDPVITVSGLRFVAADGRPTLEIDWLRLRLDSLQSLWHAAPLVSEAELDGLRLAVDYRDGRFSLRGWPGAGGGLSLDYALAALTSIEHLHAQGVDIAFNSGGEDFRLQTQPGRPWRLELQDGARHLSLEPRLVFAGPAGGYALAQAAGEEADSGFLDSRPPPVRGGMLRGNGGGRAGGVDDAGGRFVQVLSLSGHYQGDPRDPGFVAKLFLDLPQLDLAAMAPPGARLASAEFSARLWLQAAPGDWNLTGALKLAQVSANSDAGEIQLLREATASLRYAGVSYTQGSLSIPSVQLAADGLAHRLEGLRLAVAGPPGAGAAAIQLAASLPSLELPMLSRLLTRLATAGYLPARLGEALAAVKPQGRLVDLLALSRLDGSQARLVGDLRQGSMRGYRGVPSVSAVNGFLSAGPASGYFDLDNPAFEMHLAQLFEHSWPFDSGRGRLHYQIRPDGYALFTDLGEFHKQGGGAWLKLHLNFTPVPEHRTWAIAVGVRDLPVAKARLFLPYAMKPTGRQWVSERLQGGQAPESGLLMHGALDRRAPWNHKSLGGYFKVQDAGLRYHDDWPPLSGIAGTVSMTSHHVGAKGARARALGSELTDGAFHMPIIDRRVEQVQVTAQAQGPLADGLRLLRETPLAETTGGLTASWEGRGQMQAGLDIKVPLGDDPPPLQVDVVMNFADIDLAMNNYRLLLEGASGALVYSDADGIASPGFQGRLFGHPVTGRIDGSRQGRVGETLVQVDGRIDMPSLHAWSGQPILTQTAGKARYQATLRVPYGGRRNLAAVEVTTDLKGVTLDLPAPLAKRRADTAMPFRYRQEFLADGQLVELAWPDLMGASFKLQDDILVGGRFHFGQTSPLPAAYDAVSVTGYLESMRFEEWHRLMQALIQVTGDPLDANIRDHFGVLALAVDELLLADVSLGAVDLTALREADRWQAGIKGEILAGALALPDAAPPIIDLDYLHLRGEVVDEDADPLGQLDPLAIVDLDFATRSLKFNDDDYGSWAFAYRRQEGGVRLSGLRADSKGVRILDDSTLVWSPAGSHLTGKVEVDDVGLILKEYGFAGSVQGQDFAALADLRWQGSPANFDFMEADGVVQLLQGQGRFVQVKGGGALKLLGIFDFAQLGRRLRLDFSDIVDAGFEFNEVTGTVQLAQGKLKIIESVQIESPSGTVKLGGLADLNTGALDNEMIVTLPLRKALPWYAAYSAAATGPLAGLGVLLARSLFKKQIDALSSAKYRITGTFDEPQVEFDSVFGNKLDSVEDEKDRKKRQRQERRSRKAKEQETADARDPDG